MNKAREYDYYFLHVENARDEFVKQAKDLFNLISDGKIIPVAECRHCEPAFVWVDKVDREAIKQEYKNCLQEVYENKFDMSDFLYSLGVNYIWENRLDAYIRWAMNNNSIHYQNILIIIETNKLTLNENEHEY